MAFSTAQSQYLADLLTGLGSGFMSAPRGGPPLAGFSMGIQNAGQITAQRRQQQDADQERAYRAQQMARQQKMDAEADAQTLGAKKAFSQLLPTGANPGGYRPTGAGPGASASFPVSPGPLSGLPAPLQSAITTRGQFDPAGALDMYAKWAMEPPQPPKIPKMETYFSDGMKISGYWKPNDPTQFVVLGKSADKSGQEDSLRFGLNPVYGQDENGRTVILLPNTAGGVRVADLPPGVTISPQAQFLNTGTALVAGDKHTGLPIPGAAPIPIDNSGKTSQTTQGEAQGKVAAGLPDTIAGADLALKTIEDLKTDPARETATGLSSLVMTKVPGTPAYDYAQKVNQAKGQVFRQVYESLRGGGAITEIEGGKAEQALARLDTAQTEDGFLQALNELETIIKAGAERAKQKAAAGPQIMAPDAVPAITNAAPAVPPPPPGFEIAQ